MCFLKFLLRWNSFLLEVDVHPHNPAQYRKPLRKEKTDLNRSARCCNNTVSLLLHFRIKFEVRCLKSVCRTRIGSQCVKAICNYTLLTIITCPAGMYIYCSPHLFRWRTGYTSLWQWLVTVKGVEIHILSTAIDVSKKNHIYWERVYIYLHTHIYI